MKWRLAVVVVSLTCGACFPAIVHGPAVEPGVRVTALASQARGPTYVEGDEGGIRLRNPPVGVGVGYGWRAASEARPSLFAGAFVPVLVPAVQLDLYAQAPRAWTAGASAGLGVVGDLFQVMPYAQAGRVSGRGVGWSTVQGVSVRFAESSRSRSVAWIPGVMAHWGGERVSGHAFVMAAVGREPGDCIVAAPGVRECRRGRASRVALVGGAVAFHRRRAP